MDIIIENAVSSDASALLTYFKKIGEETDNLSFGAEGLPFSCEEEAAYILSMEGSQDDALFLAKIDGHQITYCRGGLIHQTARLTKIDIFRILTDLCHLRWRSSLVEEQMIDDRADQYFKSGGGTESGAGEHGRLAIGIKACPRTTELLKTGCYTANQRSGGIYFFRVNGCVR